MVGYHEPGTTVNSISKQAKQSSKNLHIVSSDKLFTTADEGEE